MHKPRSAEALLRGLSILTPDEIELEVIAHILGARVKYRELDGCEAYLLADAKLGRAIISIDDRAIPTRKRFSLAHEIGHWEWHRGQQLICGKEDIGGGGGRGRPSGLNREKTANQFAAELIMPSFMLREIIRDFKRFDMRAVTEAKDIFDVSKTAMAYRLVELEYQPSLLACYSKDGLQWHVRSKSVDRRWRLHPHLDSESNAHSILFDNAPDDRSLSSFEGDTWFEAPAWAHEAEVKEQSFRIGDQMVMSLLIPHSNRMLAV